MTVIDTYVAGRKSPREQRMAWESGGPTPKKGFVEKFFLDEECGVLAVLKEDMCGGSPVWPSARPSFSNDLRFKISVNRNDSWGSCIEGKVVEGSDFITFKLGDLVEFVKGEVMAGHYGKTVQGGSAQIKVMYEVDQENLATKYAKELALEPGVRNLEHCLPLWSIDSLSCHDDIAKNWTILESGGKYKLVVKSNNCLTGTCISDYRRKYGEAFVASKEFTDVYEAEIPIEIAKNTASWLVYSHSGKPHVNVAHDCAYRHFTLEGFKKLSAVQPLTPIVEKVKESNMKESLDREEVINTKLCIDSSRDGTVDIMVDGVRTQAAYTLHAHHVLGKYKMLVWAPELKAINSPKTAALSCYGNDGIVELKLKQLDSGGFYEAHFPTELISNTQDSDSTFLFYQSDNISKYREFERLPEEIEFCPTVSLALPNKWCANVDEEWVYFPKSVKEIKLTCLSGGMRETYSLPIGGEDELIQYTHLPREAFKKLAPLINGINSRNNVNDWEEAVEFLNNLGESTAKINMDNPKMMLAVNMLGQLQQIPTGTEWAIIEGTAQDILVLRSPTSIEVTVHPLGEAKFTKIATKTLLPTAVTDPSTGLQYAFINKSITNKTRTWLTERGRSIAPSMGSTYYDAHTIKQIARKLELAAPESELSTQTQEKTNMDKNLPVVATPSALSPVLDTAKSAAMAGLAMAASAQSTKLLTAVLKRAGVSAKALKHPLVQMILTAGTPMALRALAPHIPGANNPKILAGLELLQQTSTAQVTAQAVGAALDIGADFLGSLGSLGQLMLMGNDTPEPTATVTQEEPPTE